MSLNGSHTRVSSELSAPLMDGGVGGIVSSSSFDSIDGAGQPLSGVARLTRLLTCNRCGRGGGGGGNDKATKKKGLGTYFGVFQPCLLNIFGAVLFLRLTWSIGYAGWGGVVLVFAIAGLTVTLTTLSIAAISTNGTMKGGGAYYMISRSLGAELGGACGVIYFVATVVAITFYVSSFTDGILAPFNVTGGWWILNHRWLSFFISSGTLFVLLITAMIGAGCFLRLYVFIFIALMVSIAISFGSTIIGTSYSKGLDGWHHPDASVLWDNVGFSWGPNKDPLLKSSNIGFASVFAVIFPACTGILAGANYSGDLENPGKSIGSGTLAAIAVSMVIYFFLTLGYGGSIDRELLKSDTHLMQHVALHPAIIVVGLVSSTISSALGALVGSARVMQALAADELLPPLRIFRQMSSDGEPRVAILFAWAIAQALLLIGDLNAIAALCTNFFLIVYFLINAACFALKLAGVPNFRPRFKYFTAWTALLGAILSLAIALYLDWIMSSISIAVLFFVALYIYFFTPAKPWGDVSQALIFHQVRKYLLRLDASGSTHTKLWRPSIFLSSQAPESQLALIDFCNNLKKGGLFIIGSIVRGGIYEAGDRTLMLKRGWQKFLQPTPIKAFTDAAFAPSRSVRLGLQSLMVSSGLGGMSSNTVVLEFDEDTHARHANSVHGSGLEEGGATPPFGGGAVQDAGTPPPGRSEAMEAENAELRRRLSLLRHERRQTTKVPPAFARSKAAVAKLQVLIGEESEARATCYELVGMCSDALRLQKHLVLCRHFRKLDKSVVEGFHKRARSKIVRLISARRGEEEEEEEEEALKSPAVSDESDDAFPISMGTSDGEEIEYRNDLASYIFQRERPSMSTDKMFVDVWCFDRFADTEQIGENEENPFGDFSGDLALQLQLASILKRTDVWKKHAKLRIVCIVPSPAFVKPTTARLVQLLDEVRINARTCVIPLTMCESPLAGSDSGSGMVGGMSDLGGVGESAATPVGSEAGAQQIANRMRAGYTVPPEVLNAMMRKHSSNTAVAFIVLPKPPLSLVDARALREQEILANPWMSPRSHRSHSAVEPSPLSESSATAAVKFLKSVDLLTRGLPPTCLVRNGRRLQRLISTEL